MIRPVYFGNELEMSMIRRMIGSALLRANVFEEVEHDHTATLQAALVVIIVSISTALGSYFTFGGNFIIGCCRNNLWTREVGCLGIYNIYHWH